MSRLSFAPDLQELLVTIIIVLFPYLVPNLEETDCSNKVSAILQFMSSKAFLVTNKISK